MLSNAEYEKIKYNCFARVYPRLNGMQLKAVCAVKGPLLVLAGAGSGKTTVLVNRVYQVMNFGSLSEEDRPNADIEANAQKLKSTLGEDASCTAAALRSISVAPASPDEVLCITFTNKAADEFKSRLEKMLGGSAEGIWAGTFHSVCVRILRRHIGKLGFSNSFAIYDADDSRKLVKQILKEKNIDEKLLSEKYVCACISRFKEQRVLPDEAEIIARDRRDAMIAEVYSEYRTRLKAASALDFNDLILNTLLLFEEFPEVLEYYSKQFRYIFVDEYQDTNPSQNDLVIMLSKHHRNVCVVGDDDQSIYSFRGAAVENILQFDTEFPDARLIKLEQNYRSTGMILEAANALISHNRGRKGKTLWTDSARGDKVAVRCLYTQVEEAEFIKDEIERLRRKGEELKDIAVLYRANALSRSIETALVKARIPYRVYGGIKYYERKEVKDILAYLSLVCNRADDVRLRRIINVPRRSIGETTVEKIASIAGENGTSMYSVISHAASFPQLARVCAKLEQFHSLIEELSEYAKEHTVAELIAQTIDSTGYDVMLEDEYEPEKKQNLEDLVSAGALFDQTAETPSAEEFLAEIALVSDTDSYDPAEQAVSLLTVHSAKGLEFGTVFIAGAEQGIFPSQQSVDEGGIEEERRLAYVAVTRAKRRLYITYTQSRMIYGMHRPSTPSEFIDEIPPQYKDLSQRAASPYANRADDEFPAWGRGGYSAPQRKVTDFIKEKPREQIKKAFFAKGQRVSHSVFGEGTVTKCEQMGNDALVTVEFDSGSTKNLMASFAKLKNI